MEITTKHASNSPVTFVTHKRFVVLFFLPSCFVHSLRSLTSKRLQEKTPLCRPFFENLHFWCRNALNGKKKLSVFRTIKIRVDGHLIKQVPSLSFFCAWLWSWQHAAGGSDELALKSSHRIDQWQTGNRKAPSQSHLPLCFPANATLILVWVQTFYISFAKQQSKRERLPQGYVIIYLTYPATSRIVLWLIHFLSTKNDYAIPWFIKSDRSLSFLYAISISNLMY